MFATDPMKCDFAVNCNIKSEYGILVDHSHYPPGSHLKFYTL